MAKAKKLPSGQWRTLVYSHTSKDGKRHYESFTADTRKESEYLAAQFALTKSGNVKTNMTFGEALDRYIQTRESVLSPRTIMDYKRIRAHDLQSLMDIRLEKITQDLIQDAINEDSKIHSPKTVRNNHGLISAVMRQYRPGFALNTELPKKVRPDIYVPTDEEIKYLMEIAKDTDLELPVLLAAFGPMRRGEICALHSRNISGNIVHVCENMVITENKNWIIKSPKSYAGDRYVDYPDFVAKKWKDKVGRVVELTPDQITAKFSRLLKRASMSHFRFHDLRHPYVKPTTKNILLQNDLKRRKLFKVFLFPILAQYSLNNI